VFTSRFDPLTWIKKTNHATLVMEQAETQPENLTDGRLLETVGYVEESRYPAIESEPVVIDCECDVITDCTADTGRGCLGTNCERSSPRTQPCNGTCPKFECRAVEKVTKR
jgi:hypothetical protein